MKTQVKGSEHTQVKGSVDVLTCTPEESVVVMDGSSETIDETAASAWRVGSALVRSERLWHRR